MARLLRDARPEIGGVVLERAAEEGDRPYLTFGARTYSFGETEQRCRDLARGLANTPAEPAIGSTITAAIVALDRKSVV